MFLAHNAPLCQTVDYVITFSDRHSYIDSDRRKLYQFLLASISNIFIVQDRGKMLTHVADLRLPTLCLDCSLLLPMKLAVPHPRYSITHELSSDYWGHSRTAGESSLQ